MVQDILCSLPLAIKIALVNSKTLFNLKKIAAICKINKMQSDMFENINNKKYKKNLKKYLYANFFSSQETIDYINYLYNDKIILENYGKFDASKATIICVVKNEADKLENFFEHYKKIGNFNYIFIDNGSTDSSKEIILKNNCRLYSCLEPFSTNRKLAWINKVYSEIPNGSWTILLDADELLVYDGYEIVKMDSIFIKFEKIGICSAGAVMIDMFSNEPIGNSEYKSKYIYFENRFHEKKSFYFNSIYGGIREREFKFGKERIFLIKKHPILKKDEKSMLIHCHYNFPFKRNFESKVYFGLLHYKLFDSEIEKYRRIAASGSYENGSEEYKNYISVLNKKTYAEIFTIGEQTVKFEGTKSLKKIQCLSNIGEIL